MPRLPTYEDVATVSPRVKIDPGVNAPLAAFQSGAGVIAGELAPGINDVASVVREEEKRKDNAAVNDYRRQLLELETEKDEWLSQQKGENAFTAKQKLDKDIDARTAKINEGLKNDRQRILAKEVEGDWRVGINRKASHYISKEMDSHYDNVDNKLIETSTRAAQKAASTGDFDRVQQEWSDQEKVIAGLADRKGLSPVQRQELLDSRKSEYHAGIVMQLMADDKDMIATDYFLANKSEMDTKAQLSLGNQLEVANTRATAQTLSDRFMAEHNNNFGLAIEEARKIKNPKVRDATLSNIRQAKSDNEAAIKLNEDEAFTSALQTIQETGDVQKIPPSVWVNIGTDGHAALEKMAAETREKRTPVTDQKVWNEFNRKSTDRHWLKNLSEKDFGVYLSHFDDGKRDRASELRDAAKKAAKGDPKAKELLRNDVNLKRLVSAKVVESGLIPANVKVADMTQEQEAILSEVEARASSELERIQIEQGSKATVEQERDVVNRLVLDNAKAKVKGTGVNILGASFFETKKPVNEMTQEERQNIKFDYKAVPIGSRSSLRKMAADLGISDVSDGQVAEAYSVFMSTRGLPRADREARIAAILRGQ